MRGLVAPMFVILDPGFASMQILDIDRVLALELCKLVAQILDDERVDIVWDPRWDQTDAEHS
jgi:hypothetical protein